jgi:hypothetical protein
MIAFKKVVFSVLLLVAAGQAPVLAYPKHTIYVRKGIDLKGEEWKLEEGAMLIFKGGMVKNGKIIGNKSVIKASPNLIFEDIVFEGTWNNKEVYAAWFPIAQGREHDNAPHFKNMMTLCHGEIMTHLYVPKGVYYVSTISGASNINIPSKTYWHNEATIVEIPNDFTKSSLVLIHGSNDVTIDGGVFIGDVTSHKGTEGEWCHGIKCAGAQNTTLKNLVCREFWGDGIDLIEGRDPNTKVYFNCNDIRIENVACLYNRRQGMSVEAAINVIVMNSVFAYTGQIRFTKPGAGVDVEPWRTDVEKIRNIEFIDCRFHNNRGFDFHSVPNWKLDEPTYLLRKNDIELTRCNLGIVYIGSTNGILLRDCKIGTDVNSLSKREGFVSGNDLAILRITRAKAQVVGCEVENKVEDVFTLAVRNSDYTLDLPVVLKNNRFSSTSVKHSGPFQYAMDISSPNCKIEGNEISVQQGILIRTSRAQKTDEAIVLQNNKFVGQNGYWKKACLTFRSSNLSRRFSSIHINDNTVEGFPYVMENDNSTHIIDYSGISTVPLERGNSLSTIKVKEGSIQRTAKGKMVYKKGQWQKQ